MSRAARTPASPTPPLPRELDAARAQRLIEAGGDVALVLDADGTVLDGYAHDKDLLKTLRRDWIGQPLAELVTVESRDKLRAMLDDALADEPPVPRQMNHPQRGSPDLPLMYTAVRLAGGPKQRGGIRLVALGRDLRDTVALQRRLIDAQQTMERDYWRFREAETRYRNLFQSSTEAVLIVDGVTLRVLEANPASLALIETAGAKSPRVVGAGAASLFAPEDADPLSAALASARSVGKPERVKATLAASNRAVIVSVSSFRQERASYLLLRLLPMADPRRTRTHGLAAAAAASATLADGHDLASAYVRGASDAVAYTDTGGRVVAVNAAFARLAQLASEEQARNEPLDRWLGRTGVELSVLLTNLRERGSTGLFSTELRGAQGLTTEVEVAASSLDPPGPAAYAFSLRDIGRRLAPSEQALPTKVPASVQQLTELVGRVPLKQIVAETSDLIERLSIETALQMTRDNRAMAAQLLGLSRQSLYVKLRRFGMGGLDDGSD